jgi:hypothetical protein
VATVKGTGFDDHINAHDGVTDSIALILGRDRVGGNAQFSLRR